MSILAWTPLPYRGAETVSHGRDKLERRIDMSIMADLDGAKYDVVPDRDYAALAQEYWKYVEETEELPWQSDRFEARPIDTQEKERLVKQKCACVAQRLRAQERNECR
jgi:hypothetical protein